MRRTLSIVYLGLLALLIPLLSGCTSDSAECRSDSNCPTSHQCVSGGGVLIVGGRCVSLHDGSMTDGTDAAPDADIGDGSRDSAPPDTSSDSTLDTSPDCASPSPGCPCAVGDTSTGVCDQGNFDDDLICRPPESHAEDETACDQLDNDCDGVVDEGCPCNFNEKETGVCSQKGTLDPDDGNCNAPADFEVDEASCDGLDNDCDGTVDEGCPCDYDEISEGVCADSTIDAMTEECLEPDDYQSEEVRCDDGLDNDCDGEVDETTGSPGDSCQLNCECPSNRCIDGKCAHRAFATSQQYDGDLGGISGGHTICRGLARDQNLGGDWKAILSDSSSDARDVVSVEASVVDLRGNRIASASNFWSDTHHAALAVTETSDFLDRCGNCVVDHVWTGTLTDGTRREDVCNDWMTNGTNTEGTTGDASDADLEWIQEEVLISCGETRHLYCIDGQ